MTKGGGDRGLEWSEKDNVIYEQPLSSISFSLSSFVCLCKLLFENCVVFYVKVAL